MSGYYWKRGKRVGGEDGLFAPILRKKINKKYRLMYPCSMLVLAATYCIVFTVAYFAEKTLGLLEYRQL